MRDKSFTYEDLNHWIRDYCQSRVNSRIIDERRTIPPHIVLDFGNAGLFGLRAPQKYGGLFFSLQDTLKIIEQLSSIDPTLGYLVATHNSLGLFPITEFGTETAKNELIPLMAEGRILTSFAITEVLAGSNPSNISAFSTKESSGNYIINGEKIWIGLAQWAGMVTVFARNVNSSGNNSGINAFIVKHGIKGYIQGREALTMGLRGVVQNSIHLKNVSISEDYLLGNQGDGMNVAQKTFMSGRIFIAAICLGGMKRCYQIAYTYATKRHISTGLLFNNIYAKEFLNELIIKITALEALIKIATKAIESGENLSIHIYSICKIAGSEFFFEAADKLMQLTGGRGYIETNHIPQLFRDARLMRIFEGPTETLISFLGSSVISKKNDLFLFIDKYLNKSELKPYLIEKAEILKEFIREGSDNTSKDVRRQKSYEIAGEIALWEVLNSAINHTKTEKMDNAEIYFELKRKKLERKLEAILLACELPKDEIYALTYRIFTDEIGMREQLLSEHETNLDMYLNY